MKSAGFSLVELVTVMVVVGVIAAIAVPYLSSSQQVYGDLGFYNDTRAILRYAQKSAVANRRVVCVTFTATSVTLNFASAFGTDVCNTPLPDPVNANPYTANTGSGAVFAPVPADFNFNPGGQPVNPGTGVPGVLAPTQTISFSAGVQNIVVNADTGYVQ